MFVFFWLKHNNFTLYPYTGRGTKKDFRVTAAFSHCSVEWRGSGGSVCLGISVCIVLKPDGGLFQRWWKHQISNQLSLSLILSLHPAVQRTGQPARLWGLVRQLCSWPAQEHALPALPSRESHPLAVGCRCASTSSTGAICTRVLAPQGPLRVHTVSPSVFDSSPGRRCRSWLCLLSGATMDSGYLDIYIPTPTVCWFLPSSVMPPPSSILITFLRPSHFHPGEFVFALSSDDNSEFWLSTDESPLKVQMLAYVGEVRSSFVSNASGWFFLFVSNIYISPLRPVQSGQLRGSSTNTPVKPLNQFGEWSIFMFNHQSNWKKKWSTWVRWKAWLQLSVTVHLFCYR